MVESGDDDPFIVDTETKFSNCTRRCNRRCNNGCSLATTGARLHACHPKPPYPSHLPLAPRRDERSKEEEDEEEEEEEDDEEEEEVSKSGLVVH